jgi:hypothetical protein
MLLRAVEAVLRGRDKEWPETGLALWEDLLAGRAVDLLANLRVARLWVCLGIASDNEFRRGRTSLM